MKEKEIEVIQHGENSGIPAGRDIFYLCLICKTTVASYPKEFTSCNCGNVIVDVDAGRGGANDLSKLIVLKIN